MTSSDFLGITEEDIIFQSLKGFFGHLKSVNLDDEDNLKVIGSVSDFDNTGDFVDSLQSHFTLGQQAGRIWTASAQVSANEERVPYYIYVDNTFPIFFTTGTLTKEIPPTLNDYLLSNTDMSRMWIAKRQLERLRKSLVGEHSNILIPFFTGRRTKNVQIPAQRRGDVDRTIVYYGDDGLETFREMKHQYGVLPTNIDFELPGRFKFRIKENGIFTLQDGGIDEVHFLLDETKSHLRRIKDAIDTSKYGTERSRLLERDIPYSEPWEIGLESGLDEGDVSNFANNIDKEDHDLTVTEFSPSYSPIGFSAEIVDTENFARADLRSAQDRIRIYPRDTTDIDQNIRLYNFVDDFIDPNCTPIPVQ
ncbi:hypothetical protein [Halodesulfurarchaeum sp.]|uniref:hypothetical protein n=1 Tax=Halodesulfurarchaeum sp. TaxID=1980530 RepID=UPI002FC3AC6A